MQELYLKQLDQTQHRVCKVKKQNSVCRAYHGEKGIKTLLETCAILKKSQYIDYSLLIVRKGDQREEPTFIKERHFEDQVIWAGWSGIWKFGFLLQQ